MRLEKKTAYLSLCAGLGFTAACSAVLGIKDFTAAKGGAEGGTQDDGGPSDDASGDVKTPGDGGEASMPPCMSGVPELGCACTTPFQSACNGAAQSEQIICQSGTWVHRGTCNAGMNCDGRDGGNQGMCANVDPTCADAGAAPSQAICTNNAVVQCGPDLVSSTTPMWCDGSACVDGGCTGSCVPGAAQCAPHAIAQNCSSVGQWTTSQACPEGCEAGTCTHFPSCNGNPGAGTDCGAAGDAATGGDCCASLEVPTAGVTFYRQYDGTSPSALTKNYPAALSAFRLDAYEVTVGRFRNFVGAVTATPGWTPPTGSGKHAYLNGGSGLANNAADGGGFESGWLASWNANLAPSANTWNTNLGCPGAATWTSAAGANEHLPIGCVTWYEAYAFCIWDGGFLPSDAEWNFAASAGNDQRVYPWASICDAGASCDIDCNHANYQGCNGNQASSVGSLSPVGDGRFGQSDLAGNVWEWTLDSYAPLMVGTCNDCATITSGANQVTRGGAFNIVPAALLSTYRNSSAATTRDPTVGIRCGRAP